MRDSFIAVVCIVLALCEVSHGNQLIMLNVPSGVKLATTNKASLLDVQALPHQLFGLDETQSGLLSDVSFFHRPSLLTVITVACGSDDDAACALGQSKAPPAVRIRLDTAADPLLFQPTGSLADAVAAARLDKSLLASTSSLADSTHPALFAGLDMAGARSLPALPDEAGLPDALVRQMRLVQAAVDRMVASGLLADSQPDALQIDVSAAAAAGAAGQRRVAQFVASLADRLTAAAGPDRALVAMATAVSPAAGAAAAPPPPLVRVGRSLMAAAEPTGAPSGGMNLAPDYSQDFPVMFNLILWLSVVLVLAVYAVAYGLWNIDPGKDSIIYRRGYAHAKKD